MQKCKSSCFNQCAMHQMQRGDNFIFIKLFMTHSKALTNVTRCNQDLLLTTHDLAQSIKINLKVIDRSVGQVLKISSVPLLSK